MVQRMEFAQTIIVISLSIVLLGGTIEAATLLINNQMANTCEELNCESAQWRGAVQRVGSAPNAAVVPFTASIQSHAGQCLRLDLREVTANLHMTLVAPNGIVWRNNDSDSDGNGPLIMVDPTPESGFYTVVVSTTGNGPTPANFLMNYGQYLSGNANCLGALSPVLNPVIDRRPPAGPN